MNKERLFELYEKLYFHEMEVRERIQAACHFHFAHIMAHACRTSIRCQSQFRHTFRNANNAL